MSSIAFDKRGHNVVSFMILTSISSYYNSNKKTCKLLVIKLLDVISLLFYSYLQIVTLVERSFLFELST